jgi:hypothetical protein
MAAVEAQGVVVAGGLRRLRVADAELDAADGAAVGLALQLQDEGLEGAVGVDERRRDEDREEDRAVAADVEGAGRQADLPVGRDARRGQGEALLGAAEVVAGDLEDVGGGLAVGGADGDVAGEAGVASGRCRCRSRACGRSPSSRRTGCR